MMDISAKYNQNGDIFLKFRRHSRRIVDLISVLMLICSVGFSCFVIYKKKNNAIALLDLAKIAKNSLLNGVNMIDNLIYSDLKIKIAETKHIKKDAILQIVKNAKKKSQYDYSSIISNIKNEILAIPFAKHVIVKKRPFRSLEIVIKEREIAAYSVDIFSKQIYIIDSLGDISLCQNCKIASNEFPYIENFSSEDIEFFHQMYQSIRQNCPKMEKYVEKYVNISSRRWDAVMKNGVKIMLPAHFSDEELQKVCTISDEQLSIFSDNYSQIQYVDARVDGRIYYKPR